MEPATVVFEVRHCPTTPRRPLPIYDNSFYDTNMIYIYFRSNVSKIESVLNAMSQKLSVRCKYSMKPKTFYRYLKFNELVEGCHDCIGIQD